MWKRLKGTLESIVFVGLKPSGAKPESKKIKWLGPLSGPVERFLSGPAPTDPLYLTNRTFGQKARSWILIGLPLMILLVGLGVTMSSLIDPPEVKPVPEPSAKEIAARILPNISKDIRVEQNNDVEVVEVKIDHENGSRLTGVIRNVTNHDIANARLVVDLTDINGSQVGGVEAKVENIPPSKTKPFSLTIAQRNAAFALVREVTTGRK
jgi:hypothetical protein